MKPTPRLAAGFGLAALGIALAAAGIYLGEIDDAPGAALIGIVLMFVLVGLGVRTALRRTPAPRTPASQPAEA